MHATARALRKDILTDFGAPKVITTDEQNERYIAELQKLERRNSLSKAEREFAEVLTVLIEDYEEKHYPIEDASPAEVLSELMEANNLKQKDLVPVFGAVSTVSAVLNGKRKPTREQIDRLSKRFHVSPAVFF
jgi:HTH-type transcriptional regulator / antitoxin HigA